jgi:DNA-binding transcriptional regulator YiaG
MTKRRGSDRVRGVRAVKDPVARLKAAMAERKAVVDELNAELEALSVLAVEAIDEAKRAGISQADLARELGVTRQRLGQIARLTSS